MHGQKRRNVFAAFAALTILLSVTDSRADTCSASAAAIVSRSTGGTCATALTLNQQFTFTYRIRNDSIVDSGPNNGTFVQGTILAGEQLVATLAQATSGVAATQLPGTLTFVPVCPAGSVGGTLNAGDECNPNLNQCGSQVCGCESNLPGVTCTQNGNPNKININVTQNLVFTGFQQRNLATVRVRVTDLIDPPATCGLFFARIDSTGDIMTTTDPLCSSPNTAGAQGSANLNAPECKVAGDCGDTQCNTCANVGTNNHCVLTNIGNTCGADGNATDCVAPACVDVSGEGVCQQGQIDLGQGESCTNNGGNPVGTVECQTPQCDGNGTCANTADASQDGDACGSDGNTNDCITPACLSGVCTQGQFPAPQGSPCTNNGGVPVPAAECQTPLCTAGGACANAADASQDGDPCADTDPDNCHTPECDGGACDQDAVCDPTENPAECQVTISDTIFEDVNQNGIQDVGENGIPGVDVDVYSCSGGNLDVLQGSDTTDGSGVYSFSVATCDPSETLAIDVSDNFAGVLAGTTESDAFCDANNPGVCGVEVSPDVDSNCTNGVSDCRVITRGNEDDTVDCGYSTPPVAECECPGGGGVGGEFPDASFGLGAAGAFNVLQLGASSVSITGPYGGIWGDVGINQGGSLSISGSQKINGTIYKDDGGATINNGLPFVVQDIGPAAAAAFAASTNLAALPCDQTFPELKNTQTIVATKNGLNVICVAKVEIGSNKVVTLNDGGFDATFVINVGCGVGQVGGYKLNQGKLLAGTGVAPSDMLVNVCKGDASFSGGGGGCDCCKAAMDGTLLVPNGKIAMSPGLVRGGAVISSKSISIVSGSQVTCPLSCSKAPTCS